MKASSSGLTYALPAAAASPASSIPSKPSHFCFPQLRLGVVTPLLGLLEGPLGRCGVDEVISKHIKPFEGANLETASLEFTGIDPEHPFRKQIAINETDALNEIFRVVRKKIKDSQCTRAVLVGHNASFDLSFLNACVERNDIKRNPFHPFSTFDTVSLSGLVYGQTVLSRAAIAAGLKWDEKEAHSARYDAEQTALYFATLLINGINILICLK